ncbi:NADP-dependent oxidoreductase [Arthrobacter bambusae]|jgi:NADPH-dependent curcumin reductase CurA|uniref:NADP-dependent oxidoreductase n=1 Tax=Arthrobacter bambusae TaxID=1338426 RepID=UPI0027875CE2|nr:NADP-dependent oxidoreductase [Arthrobacter bambusae]MDQ0209959.1 NADPH-dependent curcumin reductase CurA [Arthrobacter bambusae]MDQ0235101.1 NADPH-dependent curcumin reductase CurA [Arthrobacter bambusae]
MSAALPTRTREIQLASRPQGRPATANFRLAESDLPELQDGQVLVRNEFMSVDPYMRGRMNDAKSYSAPFQLDAALDGGAVGEVIASRSESLKVGDVVVHQLGWREYSVVDAASAMPVPAGLAPTSAFLGALGMTGLTAYAGLLKVAEFKTGDVVFVSGAAGAVGSIVGQVAKAMGASKVIGSAGSPEKVARLLELGFDAAFDYHNGPVVEQLREAAGERGIDVYFDNVGGEHLEAALAVLTVGGRVAMCGAISQYNSTEPTPGPRNLAVAIGKQLTLRGFLVSGQRQHAAEFGGKMAGWLADGTVRYDETIIDGLENAPQAFIDLLDGANTGKMLVRLGERRS